MASNRKIMVLPGDGIGTEIMAANMKIIDWLAKHRSIDFDMQEGLVGGAAYDAHGTPLTDETLADSIASSTAAVMPSVPVSVQPGVMMSPVRVDCSALSTAASRRSASAPRSKL